MSLAEDYADFSFMHMIHNELIEPTVEIDHPLISAADCHNKHLKVYKGKLYIPMVLKYLNLRSNLKMS